MIDGVQLASVPAGIGGRRAKPERTAYGKYKYKETNFIESMTRVIGR